MNRHLALLSVVMASIAPSLDAQSDSPASSRAKEFVNLINTGTPAAIRAYADSAFAGRLHDLPPQAHLDFTMSQRELSKGLDWVGVQAEEPNGITVLLKRRLGGDLIAMRVDVEDAATHRVLGIGPRPARPKNGVAAQPVITTDAEMASALERYVTTLAQADVFSGSVLLARDGKALYSGAFGQANKDFGVPNNLQTKFNLGSMNKMFT